MQAEAGVQKEESLEYIDGGEELLLEVLPKNGTEMSETEWYACSFLFAPEFSPNPLPWEVVCMPFNA